MRALKSELQINPQHEAARALLNKISLFAPQDPSKENLLGDQQQ